MRLTLHPYNPDAELRERAARAIANFSREYDEIKDPGVRVEEDAVDRGIKNRKAWNSSAAGRLNNRRRMARRRELNRRLMGE